MLNKAYARGCAQAVQDAIKEAWWKTPLVGSLANIAYDQILNDYEAHSLVDSALRGALIGTGASVGARIAQKTRGAILGGTAGAALGYVGGRALSSETPR